MTARMVEAVEAACIAFISAAGSRCTGDVNLQHMGRAIAAFLRAVEPSEGMSDAWVATPAIQRVQSMTDDAANMACASQDWRFMADALAEELEG